MEGTPVRGPLKIVGMAFQNPTLLPWRTTLDNVLLPWRSSSPTGGSTAGTGPRTGRRPWSSSGPWAWRGSPAATPGSFRGMQQRASLCRALIHEPDILLLDEPFGALDAFTREELWLVLQKLCMERKCTTVLVTHDLREAIFLADTVHVMSKRPGRLVARREVSFPRPRGLEVAFTPSSSTSTRGSGAHR